MSTRLLLIQGLLLISFCNLLAISHSEVKASQNEPVSKLIYKQRVNDQFSIFLDDGDGKPGKLLINLTVHDGYPAISPDHRSLAFYGKYDDYKTWSIHLANIDGSEIKRVTKVPNVWDSAPTWSPDGKTIAFAREYKDNDENWVEQIWLMDADGTNQRQIKPLAGRSPEFISNERLLFQSKASPSQICMANIDGSDSSCLTNDDTNNMSPKLSPDGKQIAYLSNRDGNQEVYVMAIDGSNQKRLTFNKVQDWDPAWSVDGEHIFYTTPFEDRIHSINRVSLMDKTTIQYLENGSQATVIR